MQFLTNTNIDFMKYRTPMAVISTAMAVLGLIYVGFLGKLNIGIDFAGGTQVTVQFLSEPDLDQLRTALNAAGFTEARIQRFGAPGSSEVLVRTAAIQGSEEGASEDLLQALDAQYNSGQDSATDLNRQSSEALTNLLTTADPEGFGVVPGAGVVLPEAYVKAARSIFALRREEALIRSWEELAAQPDVTPAMVEAIKGQWHLGNFVVQSVENVGPQIGSELKSKGIWAVILSLAGMLAYIAIRFELRFGIGAVVAIIHDVAVTLGLFAFAGYEFNLTTIAAFLTLAGYSVNDTVVVFDRVRENMRRFKREKLETILNQSMNQTLARTVMTSGTTLLVVVTIFLFGGDVLHGFGFILLAGIVVGTYSSIFVASPVVLLWEKYFGREARTQRSRVR